MDPNNTQPLASNITVLYRCSCGKQSSLETEIGGTCPVCGRIVSPRVLKHELALTMTLQGERGELSDIVRQIDNDDTDADHLIGQRFGHFEIVRPLGSGGMGQVYQALDTSLQRYVAVKVLRGGNARSEGQIDSLLQEAVSQARVTHPNIVTIYYVGKEQGNPFLAMELVTGNSLSKLIADGSLTFSQISSIGLQLAKALCFSHELDIIHGDIKPGNILVQNNGNVKLSDFGMARRASDDSSGRIGGTPNYIAPELLDGKKPTVQSDMYALGVTLYEMSFGRHPVALTGTTIPDWVKSHQTAKIEFPQPWPEYLPVKWRDLLQRLLAADPDQRFQDYESLVAELERVQPASRLMAKRFPRFVAAFMDWASILLLMAPIQSLLAALHSYFLLHPLLHFGVQLTVLIPILIYTAVIGQWKQSLGRHLMHVRVVNQYDLKPTGKTMMFRSLMRMCVPWLMCLSDFFNNTEWISVIVVLTSIFVIVSIVWILDVILLMFNPATQCLHDLIFKTRVVVDTD